jgi:hypothetical protein
MSPFNSRQFILVFVASAVAAGSLLIPETALAAQALFRVEQHWHKYPNPGETVPGGAGLYQGYIQPYTYYYNPAVATAQPGNPVGGAFTLPQSFITYTGTFGISYGWVWPTGYTTYWYEDCYNGPGKFGPSNGATGPTRIVFPTANGNPYPTYNGTLMKWTGGNHGYGAPITPTTTFDGRYDVSRGGSITVTPGPRRFGGTFRMFYGPNAGVYQYIYYFTPALYKAYGIYTCRDDGNVPCTPNTFVSTAGEVTQYYIHYRYLLNVTGTGTGGGTSAATAKGTTPTTPNGRWPTENGNASYVVGVRRYLTLIHPWTTGFAKVHNAKGSGREGVRGGITPPAITPQAQGYDYKPATYVSTLTVTRSNAYWTFNTTNQTVTTYTRTFKQYLYSVGRIVSMVRPRLIHSYKVPLNTSEDPIINHWQAARLWRLKVFFLPESAGMLLLAAGVGVLVVLRRIHRQR